MIFKSALINIGKTIVGLIFISGIATILYFISNCIAKNPQLRVMIPIVILFIMLGILILTFAWGFGSLICALIYNITEPLRENYARYCRKIREEEKNRWDK